MIAQRKRPAIRVGPRLAGFPSESVAPAPIPVPSSIVQVQATVAALMEAVAAVEGVDTEDTDEQVKQAVRDTFSPPVPEIPVKRGRGRPQKYPGTTVQERDRKRKGAARSKANRRLVELLRHFELDLTSEIPPGLKTKYRLEVNTYRELLNSESILTKVIREIIQDLKMIGAMKTPTSTADSAGKFMTDAPSGKGALIYSDKPAEIQGKREQQERDLSKPGDSEDFLYILPGEQEPTKGDRRPVRPTGAAPDE